MLSSRVARTRLAGLVVAVTLLSPSTALGQAGGGQLDQSFTSGNDLIAVINDCCNFVGQTFTAGRDGTLAAVNVDIYGDDGTPGDEAPLRVSIRNTENGLPGDTVLATTVVNSQNIPLSRLITLPQQPRIHSGVRYAIVVNIENPSPRDRAAWIGNTGNRYPRGVQCASFASDGLGGWFCSTGANDPFNQGFDLHFRTYVNPGPVWGPAHTDPASGCTAKVQSPYLDANQQVTAYTKVFCPRPTRLTVRSRLRSDHRFDRPLFRNLTVAQQGCLGGASCVVDQPAGTRFYKLTCPKSSSRTLNQKYFTDIIIYAGTSPPASSPFPQRSRPSTLSPFCAS